MIKFQSMMEQKIPVINNISLTEQYLKCVILKCFEFKIKVTN